jgi:hypothetical protein
LGLLTDDLSSVSYQTLLLLYTIVAASFAEITAWGGWLRASEVFYLQHGDISLCLPSEGCRHNLPLGAGAIFYTLLRKTKSSPYVTADVILASTFASGLSPLCWYEHLLSITRLLGFASPTQLVFCHPSGEPWVSSYFRHHHLYPLLQIQQQLGDPALTPYDATPGNTIPEKFYSFHTYRRGGRSHVSRSRPNCRR